MTTKITTSPLISADVLIALAKKVVVRYAHVIPNREKEDIAMQIVEQFLQQEHQITKSFNHKSKASTYCFAVLNRMCCSVIRKELPTWQKTDTDDEPTIEGSTSFTATADAFVIKDEIQLLEKIFLLLDDNRKTVVFFAYYYLHLPKKMLVCQYAPHVKIFKLLKLLTPDYEMPKRERLNGLAKVVNCVEGKNNQSDAIRMWLNKQQQGVISKLNGKWGRGNYDKGTFQTLFDIYYKNK